jgi:uncharacterized protein
VSEGVQVGRCSIALSPDLWEFYSTQVDPAMEGRGVASALVLAAMKAATGAGVRVVATCWYVEGWLDRHPEFQQLREVRQGGGDDQQSSTQADSCRIAPAVVTN